MTVFYDKNDTYFLTLDVHTIVIKFDYAYFVTHKTFKPLSVSFSENTVIQKQW